MKVERTQEVGSFRVGELMARGGSMSSQAGTMGAVPA